MIKELRKLIKRGSPDDEIGYPDPTHEFWYTVVQAMQQTAGQTVNATTAQRVATVYACTQAISESIAMLPISIYKQVDNRTTEQLDDHDLARLLRIEPNQLMDSFNFFEMLQCNILDHGNAYAHIVRSGTGKILELVPLPADQVKVELLKSGAPKYTYHNKEKNKDYVYPAEDVFHIKHRSRDGIIGQSPIEVAAGTFGFGLALQEFNNKTLENGAFLSGIIKSPHAFENDESRKQFMESFKQYMGSANAGKFGLLEQGVEYEPFQQTNQQAQLVELSKFSVIELAKIYRMPPHMIQELEKGMSYASVEQMSILFVQYTIQPWVVRWERAIKRQLLKMAGDENVYVKFNMSSLVRGDLKSRTEALVQQLKAGLKTINEARNMLDDNPVEDEIGDQIILEHNLVPADMIGQDSMPTNNTEPQAEPAAASARDVFLPVFTDTIRKLIAVETKAAKRAIKKGSFLAWADKFYKNHGELVIKNLEPEIEAYSKLTGKESTEALNRFVTYYLMYRQKFALYAKDVESKQLGDLVNEWANMTGDWVEHLLIELGDQNGNEVKTQTGV